MRSIFKKLFLCILIGIVSTLYATPIADFASTDTKSYGIVKSAMTFDQIDANYTTDGYTVVASIESNEIKAVKELFSRYDYIKVRNGLIDMHSESMCTDTGEYYNCNGTYIDKASQGDVLISKNLPSTTESTEELPFCNGRCYDARADATSYFWTSALGQQTHTLSYKKGFTIAGFFRIYGDGCFVDSNAIKICISGNKMTATYNHPTGKVSTLTANIQSKYWNSYSVSLNPNFFSLYVRQQGTEQTSFSYDNYGYLPVDGDQVGNIINTITTVKSLSTDPYEFIHLYVSPNNARKPFCSEEIALCGYDFTSTHAYSEDGSIFFGAHVSAANGVKIGMSDYYRNNMYEAEINTGDMFRSDAADPAKGGAYRTWYGDANKVKFGFTMKKTENSIQEEFGFDISKTTLTPSLIGLYRTPSDAPANYYFGHESNRKSAFQTFTVPDKNFWSDTATAINITTPSGGKITDDGYFVNDSSLCPSGQVELYGENAGKCYNFTENAGCWAGGNQQQCDGSSCGVTFPSDQNALSCNVRQPYNPEICSSGYTLNGYNTGTIISAPKDQVCRKDVATYCPSGNQRIAGSCYNQVSPSCPASYPTRSNSTCSGTSTGSCSGGTWNGSSCTSTYTATTTYSCPRGTLSGTSCLNACYVTCDGTTCTSCDGYSWKSSSASYNATESAIASISCPNGGSLSGTTCTMTYPVTCPTGYPNNTSGTLTCSGTANACSNPYSYNSTYDMCLSFSQNSCSSPYSYYSPSDICRSEQIAQCASPSSKMYDKTSSGNAKCYVPDTSHSHIYCRNDLTYWDAGNREGCYEYKGIACNNTYDNNKIIIGSGNSYSEWTGQCWTKDHDLCPSGQYILRGTHTTDYHCMSTVKDYSSIQVESAASFARSLWDYINGGTNATSPSLQTANSLTTVQEEISLFYFGIINRLPEKNGLDYWVSTLQSNNYNWTNVIDGFLGANEVFDNIFPPSLTPTQVVDTFYRRITGFTMSEPSRTNYINSLTNGTLTRSQVIREIESELMDKATSGQLPIVANKWAVASYAYNKNFQLSGSVSNSPFTTAYEMITSDSNTIQQAIDYLNAQDASSSSNAGIVSNNTSDPNIITTAHDNYVYGGKMNIQDAVCPLNGKRTCGTVSPDVLMCGTDKTCIGCTDDAPLMETNPIYGGFSTVKQIGNLFFDVSRDKHDKKSTQEIISQTNGRAATNLELMAVGNIDGWTAEKIADASIDNNVTKYIVAVYTDISKVGFLNECVVDDNMDSLCMADSIACNNGVCPYGSEFRCQPVNGQQLCSRFSNKCKNMSNPEYAASFDQSVQGASDKKNDGTTDKDGQCSGNIYIFNGNDKRCRPSGLQTGGSNCCQKGSTWFGLSQCKPDEKALGTLRSFGELDGQCKEIGSYCSTKVLGICIQKKRTYCCFSSPLARIIQEGGHTQLGIPWGSPTAPQCRGLTPTEFQKIDFSKIDFSDWINNQVKSQINNNAAPTLTNTANNIKNSF